MSKKLSAWADWEQDGTEQGVPRFYRETVHGEASLKLYPLHNHTTGVFEGWQAVLDAGFDAEGTRQGSARVFGFATVNDPPKEGALIWANTRLHAWGWYR